MPDAKHLFVTDVSGERMPDPGLFTWDIRADLVYADGALAELFGFDPHETERSLLVQTNLDRVHPNDVAALARQISDAIIAQHPTVRRYLSHNADGSDVFVSAFGRCLGIAKNNPVHYAGIVVPAETEPGRATIH